jgi:ATP-dependent Clp protease adaptor protein ClpS
MAAETPSIVKPEVTPDVEWMLAEDVGDMAHVIIHNDDVTPMEFVVIILRQIFQLSAPEAQRVMLRAHYTGIAYVMTLPFEEAKYRVGKAHSLARAAGYPLAFSIEVEQEKT